MNLMGKIFTLLIFFMSICFLVIAMMVGASHRNWKKAAADNKARADFAQTLLDQAKTKSTEKEKQLAAEQAARAAQLAQLETQLAIAEKNRDEKESQLRDQVVISTERLAALNSSERRLTQQDDTVERLQSENTKLIDDIAEQRTKVVSLTNQIYKVRGEIEGLEQMRDDLADQVTKNEKVMKALGITNTQLVDHIPKKLDGFVKGVRNNIIVVSLGTDDGLKQGHVLDVYRDKKFVGQATVSMVEHDSAAATITPEYLQRSVMEGDYVTTKF